MESILYERPVTQGLSHLMPMSIGRPNGSVIEGGGRTFPSDTPYSTTPQLCMTSHWSLAAWTAISTPGPQRGQRIQ